MGVVDANDDDCLDENDKAQEEEVARCAEKEAEGVATVKSGVKSVRLWERGEGDASACAVATAVTRAAARSRLVQQTQPPAP